MRCNFLILQAYPDCEPEERADELLGKYFKESYQSRRRSNVCDGSLVGRPLSCFWNKNEISGQYYFCNISLCCVIVFDNSKNEIKHRYKYVYEYIITTYSRYMSLQSRPYFYDYVLYCTYNYLCRFKLPSGNGYLMRMTNWNKCANGRRDWEKEFWGKILLFITYIKKV